MRPWAAIAAALFFTAPAPALACSLVPFESIEADLRAVAREIDSTLLERAAFVGVMETVEVGPMPERDRQNVFLVQFYGPDETVRIRYRTVETLKGRRKNLTLHGLRAPPPAPLGSPPRAPHVSAADFGDYSEPITLYGFSLADLTDMSTCNQPLFVTKEKGERFLIFLDERGRLVRGGPAYHLLRSMDDPWLQRVRSAAKGAPLTAPPTAPSWLVNLVAIGAAASVLGGVWALRRRRARTPRD